MPKPAADDIAAIVPDAATTKPAKPINGKAVAFDKAAADEKRKAKIRFRYENGQYVSRTDKQFAGIEDDADKTHGTVRGYGGVIAHVMQNHGVTLSKPILSAWTRGRSLPMGCSEPFPAPEPPDRYRVSTFMPWVIAHIPKPSTTAKKAKNGELPFTDYLGERQRIEMERARKELQWAEQENDGKYVLRTEAESALDAVVQKLRSIIRNAWKRQLKQDVQAELRKRGFTEEQLAAIGEVYTEVGKKIMHNIEDQCAKA